jgi:hypothetical protein
LIRENLMLQCSACYGSVKWADEESLFCKLLACLVPPLSLLLQTQASELSSQKKIWETKSPGKAITILWVS